MDKRRVVISGIGLVTPLGLGQSKNWNSLISGKSGINFLNSFDASDLSCRIGGEIPYGPSIEGKLDLSEWLSVKEKLAIEIKQIVENNKASFAFPSSSIYIEKK